MTFTLASVLTLGLDVRMLAVRVRRGSVEHAGSGRLWTPPLLRDVV